MAFEIIDPRQVLQQQRAATMRRTQSTRRPTRRVTLAVHRNGQQKQLTFSRGLTEVIGVETTHVAVLVDAEAKRLAIRPSRWGEPAAKLYRTGGAKDGPQSNRALAIGSVLKSLGVRVAKTRHLKTTVKDGLIIVDLKPLCAKGA